MNVFQAMTTFVAVVETGSMAAAAERCSMSSTMVGNYIRLLEERVGASLLRRTTRRQSLTPFGAVYFEKCREIIAMLEETDRMAQAAQTVPGGKLRITAPVTYGTESLTPRMVDYLQQHPTVDVEVVLTERSVDLTEEKFDAAIRLGLPGPSTLICRRLGDYQMTLCAAPDYLERRGEPFTPAQLQAHDALSFPYPASSPMHWAGREWQLEGPKGKVVVEILRTRAVMNNTQALRKAVLAGMGLAMLPADLVREDLRAGRLKAVLPEYRLPSRPVYLLYHKDRFSSPTLRSFINFVVSALGGIATQAR
ncbi:MULTISPECIES: LysR family transcriptional regulator [Acetobacter]|uniref:LysR family transcriptional regulator n=2 Tax=Acetobacter cerevisiae TaxID=178900 RepID=A0A149UUW6_9PROT|nr:MULTISPECIES: LysR family transcriptional regulator [Acetobacter]KXV71728.1 LysR family transcriptional regulator [Acetobacter cerevisiae]KXV78115.1 LysR family transcriptional regulator [Acetobacter cerevisiae]MCP1270378.1 LysR family transcriptional regulator [Acetobacter cerevisiae]MCP1278331.1 LysR family transcriptional regulator [Acetobacter cerevisiae]